MTLPAKLVLPDGTEYLRESSPSDPAVRRTLGYFDPPMVEYFGLEIWPNWPGDFDHANLMLRFPDSNQTQANAIAAWWVLKENDLEWLWHIQPQDEDLYANAALQNKKNWLFNSSGVSQTRPIWLKDGEIRYGLMVFSHSFVRVEGNYNFRANFPEGQTENADFVKVVGMTRDMMGPMGEFVDHIVTFQGKQYATRIRSGVIPLIEQGYVQVCTEPNRAEKISITNKGIKLMFVPQALPYPIPEPWNLPRPKSDYFVSKPDGEFYLWKGALK